MSTAVLVRALSLAAAAAAVVACNGGRFSGASSSVTGATTTATTVSGTPDILVTISPAAPAPSPSPSASPGTGTTGTQAVESAAASYSPNMVKMLVGQTVAWKNDDTVAHSATQVDGKWDTGLIAPGATSSPIRMPVGEYKYTDSAQPAAGGTEGAGPAIAGTVVAVP